MANKTAHPAQQELFGLTVDALTMAEAVGRCTDTIERGGYLSVGVINAAKVVAMRRNPALRRAVADCGIILADGQSVVWASRLLGSPLPERVAGIDLFMELLAEAARRSYRVYFLGARPEIRRRMLDEVSRRFPAWRSRVHGMAITQRTKKSKLPPTSVSRALTCSSWACPHRARKCF